MCKYFIRILLLIVIILFCCTGCYFSSFSEEKANEAAISYLNDKYGEEFVAKKGGIRTDSIAFGDNWYELTVVKKSEENEETQREFTVCISTDRKYTILGDTVIFDYYEILYEDYAIPIITKEMGDIPFILIADPNPSLYMAPPECEIPKRIDDDNNYIKKSQFSFDIYIPRSYDTGQIPDLCKKIFDSSIKGDYRQAYIVILNDDDYASLAASKDKHKDIYENNYFLQNKKYKVE